MSRQFNLLNPEFNIPSLSLLRIRWNTIPDNELREIISISEQYLFFIKYLLYNLRHHDVDISINTLDNGREIFSYVRASMIKSSLEVATSIMETALMSHASKRQYKLPEIKYRTFGRIIDSWESNDVGKKQLAKYLDYIKFFKDFRDHIHLYKIKHDNPRFYGILLMNESLYFKKSSELLDFLSSIYSN